MIEENTFAEACYDQNSIQELEENINGPADKADLAAWQISEEEWRQSIKLALAEKRADLQ